MTVDMKHLHNGFYTNLNYKQMAEYAVMDLADEFKKLVAEEIEDFKAKVNGDLADPWLGLVGSRAYYRYLLKEAHYYIEYHVEDDFNDADGYDEADWNESWAKRVLLANGSLIRDLVNDIYSWDDAGEFNASEDLDNSWEYIKRFYDIPVM
jgi:hypothetical protein